MKRARNGRGAGVSNPFAASGIFPRRLCRPTVAVCLLLVCAVSRVIVVPGSVRGVTPELRLVPPLGHTGPFSTGIFIFCRGSLLPPT